MTSTTAHEPQKLRSSCNACAEAKIGCTKEKPTCSRCARRDEPCVYAVIRRAGRPSLNKNKTAADTDFIAARSPPASVAPTIQTSSSVQIPGFPTSISPPFSSSPQHVDTMDKQIAPDYSDLFTSMMTADVASPLPMESISRDDLDEFLASIAPPPSLQNTASNPTPALSPIGEHGYSSWL
nr:geodin cluster transcription factor [Quercus suber]